MMGTVYKRSVSNIIFLQFNPAKIIRFYWMSAGVGLVICAFLSFMAIRAFQSAGEAEDKMLLFQDYESTLIYFLNLGLIVLIVLSNLCSMASKKVLYYLYTVSFAIYALFAIVDNFFLEDAFFQFKKLNQLWQGDFNFASIKGYLSLIFCAGLCAFNAVMTGWGLKK